MEKLEGKQSILAALLARKRKIELIMIKWNANNKKNEEVVNLAKKQGIPVKSVTEEEIDQATKGKTHGGLLAICTPKPITPISDMLKMLENQRHASFLLLEGVEDGQNLGFIMRTAWAMGMDGLLLKKHIWNFDPVSVSKISAGAYELLPLVKIEKEAEELDQIKKKGVKILGAMPKAKKTLYEMDFCSPIMIALGGEKRGLSSVVREACNGFFSIPMLSRRLSSKDEEAEVESLSLSHSAAIIMGEIMRQRRMHLHCQ